MILQLSVNSLVIRNEFLLTLLLRITEKCLVVWTVAADIFSKELRATKKDDPAPWDLCVSYGKRHKMTRFTRRT